MKIAQVNQLIIVVTLCLSFFVWGTVIVLRTVTDANYHTPTKMDLYKDCMNGTGYNPNSGDCKAIAGIK